MDRLRIATYNIHRGIGVDGELDVPRIASVIAGIDAHVVALQEVAFDPHRIRNVLSDLGGLTASAAIAGPTFKERCGVYGNAVLTRCPPRRVKRLDLSVPGREPRGALIVGLTLNGLTVRIVATHLGLGPGERCRQVKSLLRVLARAEAAITILLGDFNEWGWWSSPLAWLRRRFGRQPAPATYPGRRPLLALDRIWVHPASRLLNVHAVRSAVARKASDHLPLVAEVDVRV